MSQIQYIKLEHEKEILCICKVVDKKESLSIHKNDISLIPTDLTELKKDGQFKDATKQEFDDFMKKTVLRINKFSSL